MIEPRSQTLKILGYGSTVPTTEPIEAEIIVVRSYTELEERSDEVRVILCCTVLFYGIFLEELVITLPVCSYIRLSVCLSVYLFHQ